MKQDFPWERIRHQVSDPGGTSPRVVVVNECGSSDCWPVFAKCLGYGSIGTHGAGHVLVADRFHKGGHGLYFDPEFIDEYWRSYLETGSIENGREVARSGLAWYFWPFEVLPPWLLLIGFAGLVWLSLYALMLAW